MLSPCCHAAQQLAHPCGTALTGYQQWLIAIVCFADEAGGGLQWQELAV